MNARTVSTAPKGPQTRVLIVDDEVLVCKAWRAMLGTQEFETLQAGNAQEAIQQLSRNRIDVVVTDVSMPGMNGVELLRRIKAARPEIEVILMTARGSIADAVQATKYGAFDYLTKPFGEIDECINKVRQAARLKRLHDENSALRQQVDTAAQSALVESASPRMRPVMAQLAQVARVNTTVLISGPTGSGKSLIARAMHDRSARRDAPFVQIDCGTIPESLLESELFGSALGIQPAGQTHKPGLFEAASGGTIFLDEIGNLPAAAQVSLLRVLEDSTIRPLGGSKDIKIDVRVISATNADLARAIAEKRFREDLYFRLKVVDTKLPALSERREDVPRLAYHFLRRHAARMGKDIKNITPRALELLRAHEWKGNVRELDNVIEAAVVFEPGPDLTEQYLPPDVQAQAEALEPDPLTNPVDLDVPLREATERAETAFRVAYLKGLMTRFGNNVSAAARHAQVERANFRRLLKRYSITYDRHDPNVADSDEDE